MYNHFVCQLTDARLMDKNKQYKKNIDKQTTQLHCPSITLCQGL